MDRKGLANIDCTACLAKALLPVAVATQFVRSKINSVGPATTAVANAATSPTTEKRIVRE